MNTTTNDALDLLDDGGLELEVALGVLRDWQEANALAIEVHRRLPESTRRAIELAGPQDRDEVLARWVGAASTLHPSIAGTYAGLLGLVIPVLEDLAAGRSPDFEPIPPSWQRDRVRIAELEARVVELETMIAGAAAVLRAAEV